jgi:hypothetical protein
VQIHALMSHFHVEINILQYSSGRLWKYGVPVKEVLDMEAFLSTRK